MPVLGGGGSGALGGGLAASSAGRGARDSGLDMSDPSEAQAIGGIDASDTWKLDTCVEQVLALEQNKSWCFTRANLLAMRASVVGLCVA